MEAITFNAQITLAAGSLEQHALKLTRDLEKAQDLVQETLCKAIVNRDKYRDNTNLKGWLYTIMRNIFINDYRRSNRYPVLHDLTETDLLFDKGGRTVENDGEANMTMQAIENAIDKVDAKYSQPFLMYFQGFKYEEIAEKIHLPLGTIKSRIFTARKALQQELAHLVDAPKIPQRA